MSRPLIGGTSRSQEAPKLLLPWLRRPWRNLHEHTAIREPGAKRAEKTGKTKEAARSSWALQGARAAAGQRCEAMASSSYDSSRKGWQGQAKGPGAAQDVAGPQRCQGDAFTAHVHPSCEPTTSDPEADLLFMDGFLNAKHAPLEGFSQNEGAMPARTTAMALHLKTPLHSRKQAGDWHKGMHGLSQRACEKSETNGGRTGGGETSGAKVSQQDARQAATRVDCE